MDAERTAKTALLIVGLIVFVALAVVMTSGITGNIIKDVESATTPVMGAVILVAFIAAAFLITRVLVPEGKYHE